MSFAYMPLYVGDYLRDTQHLSCSEHGIYLKLIMHCWVQEGPAPLDERKLFGIVNARSSDEIEALRRVLQEFFTQTEDGWYNKRVEAVLKSVRNTSKLCADAANKRWKAERDKVALHDAMALPAQWVPNANQNHNHNHNQTKSKEGLVPVVSSLPKETGITAHNAKKTRVDRGTRRGNWFPGPEGTEFCRECRPDLNPQDVFQRFADYWDSVPGAKGRKVNWMATWRNWVRSTERAKV